MAKYLVKHWDNFTFTCTLMLPNIQLINGLT